MFLLVLLLIVLYIFGFLNIDRGPQRLCWKKKCQVAASLWTFKSRVRIASSWKRVSQKVLHCFLWFSFMPILILVVNDMSLMSILGFESVLAHKSIWVLFFFFFSWVPLLFILISKLNEETGFIGSWISISSQVGLDFCFVLVALYLFWFLS